MTVKPASKTREYHVENPNQNQPKKLNHLPNQSLQASKMKITGSKVFLILKPHLKSLPQTWKTIQPFLFSSSLFVFLFFSLTQMTSINQNQDPLSILDKLGA